MTAWANLVATWEGNLGKTSSPGHSYDVLAGDFAGNKGLKSCCFLLSVMALRILFLEQQFPFRVLLLCLRVPSLRILYSLLYQLHLFSVLRLRAQIRAFSDSFWEPFRALISVSVLQLEMLGCPSVCLSESFCLGLKEEHSMCPTLLLCFMPFTMASYGPEVNLYTSVLPTIKKSPSSQKSRLVNQIINCPVFSSCGILYPVVHNWAVEKYSKYN